ncbi:MAG: DUF4836 family protein, partial [Bacteroidia bacterium]|nr:DUF4836 family protein [Bacteroidia bacterium]
MFDKGVQTKYIQSIPIQIPSIMMGMDMNMENLYEAIKNERYVLDAEDRLKADLDKLKLSTKDIFKALTGDFFIASGDLQIEAMIQGQNIQPDFTLVAGIKNQNVLKQLLEEKAQDGDLQNQGNFYVTQDQQTGSPLYLIPKKDAFYITMSESLREQIIDGKKALDGKYSRLASDKGFVMYVNLKEIFRQVPPNLMELVPNGRVVRSEVIPKLDGLMLDI